MKTLLAIITSALFVLPALADTIPGSFTNPVFTGTVTINGTISELDKQVEIPASGLSKVSGKPDSSADGLYLLYDPDTLEQAVAPVLQMPSYLTQTSPCYLAIGWSTDTSNTSDSVIWAVEWRIDNSSQWSVQTVPANTSTGQNIPQLSDWTVLTTLLQPSQWLELKVGRSAGADTLAEDAKLLSIRLGVSLDATFGGQTP